MQLVINTERRLLPALITFPVQLCDDIVGNICTVRDIESTRTVDSFSLSTIKTKTRATLRTNCFAASFILSVRFLGFYFQQLKNYELMASLGCGYLMAIRIQLESVYNGRSVRGKQAAISEMR